MARASRHRAPRRSSGSPALPWDGSASRRRSALWSGSRREQMARPSTGCYSNRRAALNGSGAGTIGCRQLLHHGFITGGLTSRLVALIKRNNDARRMSTTVAGSLGWEFRMNQVLEPSDECPHCRLPLEILSVKVGLRGTAMVYACTNCAMTRTQNPKQPPPRRLLSALIMIGAKFGRHSSSEVSHELAIEWVHKRTRMIASKDPQEQSGS